MPKPGPIHAVVFDLDDTLYPERDYVRSGYRAASERLAAARGEGNAHAWAGWLWRRFLGGQTQDAFDALNARFRLHLSAEDIAELVEAYRTHRPAIRPWADMAAMLGRLHGGYGLGLLSDGYLPAQRLKLDALRLGRFLDAVVFTEELGRDAWKPAARGFERIADLLDARHERCAYIADNPAKDFAGANRLGWRTIQLRRTGQLHAENPPPDGGEPHFVARDPGQIHRALLEPR